MMRSSIALLKLATDRDKASRGLSVRAELLVIYRAYKFSVGWHYAIFVRY